MHENLLRIEIYQRIKNVYGKSMISVQHIRKWYRKFRSGCENIVDESHSGKPNSVADKMFENKVDSIIQRDQKDRLSNIVFSECGIWYCLEYCFKKSEISKNLCSLDTAYTAC